MIALNNYLIHFPLSTTHSATLVSQVGGMSDTRLALGVKNIQNWASKGLESGMFKIDPNTRRLL